MRRPRLTPSPGPGRGFDARWQRLALVALAGLMALVHVGGTAWTSGPEGPLVQGDARAYFAYLPSLVLDGDLDLENQFEVLRPETFADRPGHPFGEGRDGRAANPFPVGPALLWLPGYLVGLAVDLALAALGIAPRPLGYGPGAVWGAAIFSVLLAGLGAELARRLAAGTVATGPGPDAFAATLMAWVGTPLLYYTVVSPLYSHAAAAFAVAAMLWLTWLASGTSTRPGPWLWAGLAAGLVVAVRLQDAVLLVIPAAALATLASQARRRSDLAAPAAVWAGGVVLAYLPQALVGYRLHGAWLPLSGIAGPQRPTLGRLAEVLVSTGYEGWWSWTPLAVPALAGLAWAGWHGRSLLIRRLAVGGLAAVAGLVLVDLIHPYGAGASFGGRRYLSATPLLVLGLAAVLARASGRARSAAAALLAALAGWNVLLLVSYELSILRHGVYPKLAQAVRHLLGLGIG